MTAVYNEIHEHPASWISNLIAAGLVAPGAVLERSIVDVAAEDVRHARQAHFFAGIAVWSAAARAAGWPDDAPLWTGSCPCQPFSQAGRGKGTADERHLWPEWFRLIRECRPPVIVGEQVASPAGLGWLDAVFADLEGAGYACAAADMCAAGFGAPHLRQRLYFAAIANGERLEGLRLRLRERRSQQDLSETRRGREAGLVADDAPGGRQERRDQGGSDGSGSLDGCALGDAASPRHDGRENTGADRGDEGARSSQWSCPGNFESERASATRDQLSFWLDGIVYYADGSTSESRRALANTSGDECGSGRGRSPLEGRAEPGRTEEQPAGRCTDGFWYPADWIRCTDGKARPVEPGTFPLAYGATARVGRLRAYGNAIVAPQAQAFLEVVIEMLTDQQEAA